MPNTHRWLLLSLTHCVLCSGLAPHALGKTPAPATFVDLGADVGLSDVHEGPMVPAWYDIDGDGDPDPLWMSYNGVVTLDLGPDGGASLVYVDMPSLLFQPGGPTMVTQLIDADRDGEIELAILGTELGLLTSPEPYKLDLRSVPVPQLPAAAAGDVAVGDLNNDGWPDMVVALGLSAPERIEMRGHTDVVLMNLGEGRFEVLPLEPAYPGYSNAITLADVDGDRLPDVVESFDGSSFTGRSRILLNRTPPGARVPVFEEAPHTYDIGTFGMGVAVEDINGDGIMDIYGTNVSLDLMAMGQPDGTYKDETLARGFIHRWGPHSIRSQWSPTFSDLNADGALDLVVRHGDQGVAAISGSFGVKVHAADVAYVGDDDGYFTRIPVPFDPEGPNFGRMAVLGDIDRDGLPDVALGGKYGTAAFWHNTTPPPAEHRALTLRFHTTVSAWPPTGARVEAACGDRTLVRHLSSGGKMGGAGSVELYLAWPGCTTDAVVEISWPSGTTSTHQVAPDQTLYTAQEPQWWSSGPDPAVVTLDPATGGSDRACVGTSAGATDCCLASEGPCTVSVPGDESSPPRIWLQGESPMGLPLAEAAWVVLTDPDPPRPGDEVTVHGMHLGHPAHFDPSSSLFVSGDYVVWDQVREDVRILSATLELPLGLASLPLAIFPYNNAQTSPWNPTTGGALAMKWAHVDLYPYSFLGGATEPWYWSAYTTCVRRVLAPQLLADVMLRELDGTPITGLNESLMPGAVARLRVQVSWDQLQGVNALELYDSRSGASIPLLVPQPVPLEEAVGLVAGVRGGMFNTRVVEDGDAAAYLLALVDDEGRTLPPEPDLVFIETEGADVLQQPQMFSNTYDLTGLIQTRPGLGPGQIRVLAADGRLLDTFHFNRRAKGAPDISLEFTQIDLLELQAPDEGPLEATHRVRVIPKNTFEEVLGVEVRVAVEVTGGTLTHPPTISVEAGGFIADILPEPLVTEVVAEVYVEEQLAETFVFSVDPLPAPEPDVQDTGDAGEDTGEADEPGPKQDADQDDEVVPASAPTSARSSGGCVLGDPSSPWSAWPWLVGLAFLARRLRRSPIREGDQGSAMETW